MTDLNLESIAALLELEARATPGDWTYEENGGRGSWISGANGEWAALSCGDTGERAKANAALIATARNLIRPLAEAYQRQPEAIKAVQVEALRGMREWCSIEQSRAALHRSPLAIAYAEMVKNIDRRILALEKQP